MAPPAFRFLMKRQGIGDFSHVSKAELNTYLALMKGDDRGRAFPKVSRSAQTTEEKQELYRRVVGSRSYPVQVVWAVQDPAMPAATYGEKARTAAGLPAIDRIPGKHFPQEDHAPAIAARIAAIAAIAGQ
jgi:haloalkane dehalogenase